jgi:hypothetical protein
MSERADEILEGAMRVIERDGWHQGSLYKSEALNFSELTSARRLRETAQAPVCAMGAMYRASSGSARFASNADYPAIQEAIDRLIGVVQGTYGHAVSIPFWNDHRDTTKEDVILHLKKALHDGD